MSLPLEEVAVRAGHKVLMGVDDMISLIVGDPQGILDEQPRPHPIYLIDIVVLSINYIKLNIIKLLNLRKTSKHLVQRKKQLSFRELTFRLVI